MVIYSRFKLQFIFKSPAFSEEREWRLLSYLVTGSKQPCLFRSVDSQIIPYREIPLLEIERHPITQVILGPKHGTPVKVIEAFLSIAGFGDVSVMESTASYR